MPSSQIGNIGEFIPSMEDWTQYVCKSADKKQAILLTMIGLTAYQRLQNLLSPTKLGNTAYKDLVDAMAKHVNTMPSVTVQRFKFNSCICQVAKTVSAYISYCSYAQLLNIATSASR